MAANHDEFQPLNITVLTVSDTRTRENDTSGDYLEQAIAAAGHIIKDRALVIDDIYLIRAQTSAWIANNAIQVIVITGGTGFSGRDSTPEAMQPLFDKSVEGFGELFRQLSFDDIGTSTIQSRALAGIANRTLVFCLPGSTGACTLAWQKIIAPQLDCRTRPCNFYNHLKTD